MTIKELLNLFRHGEGGSRTNGPPKPETGVSIPYRHASHLASMAQPTAFRTRAYGALRVKAEWRTSHPIIQEFARKYVIELQRYKIPGFAYEYRRNREEQNAAKARGVSKAAYGHSPHNFGLAVDILPWHPQGDWWDRWTKEQWLTFVTIGAEVARKAKLPVENGGLEWGWDWPHWQLVDWKLRRTAIIQSYDPSEEQHGWNYFNRIEMTAGFPSLHTKDPAFVKRYSTAR